MVDWSKAGTRIRQTPRRPEHGGRNPDWNWRKQRWKVAAEYAAETLAVWEIVAMVPCPTCRSIAGRRCLDARGHIMADSTHIDRGFNAGEQLIKEGWTMERLDR